MEIPIHNPARARTVIEIKYNVVNGRIRSPGQFEGEMVYVPYYWELGMNGSADRDNGKVFGFDIFKDERKAFPELGTRRRTVKLYQREDGFICEQ